MNIICPNCNRPSSHRGEVEPGRKILCRSCRNRFDFLPEQHILDVTPDDDKPPPRVAPIVVTERNKPRLPRRGGIRAFEASRKSTAIILSIGLLGLLGLFINWYVSTVRDLDVASGKAALRRVARLKKYTTPNVPTNREAESRLESAKSVAPRATPLPMDVVPATGTLAQSRTGPASGQQTFLPGVVPSSWPEQPLRYSPSIAFENRDQTVPAAQGSPTQVGFSLGTSDFGFSDNRAPVQAVAAPKRELSPLEAKQLASKFYMGKKLRKDGKVRSATKIFREIVEKYPDSEEAAEARSLMVVTANTRSDNAHEQLTQAEGLERLGSREKARVEYQAIISLYPESSQAQKAKQRLKQLEKK